MLEHSLKKKLLEMSPRLASNKVTLGFDGFIDNIVRLIHHKKDNGPVYFDSVRQFGEYTMQKAGTNFSLELDPVTRKIGGNVPIMANALSQWNCKVSCIAALGYPHIHPVFRPMGEHCTLYSYSEPGITTALEFQDGKIILGEMENLNRSTWSDIKNLLTVDVIKQIMSESDLIAILNWAELDNSTTIWQGLYEEVFSAIKREGKPIAFFDLSDCSKREFNSIRSALEMLKKFTGVSDVTLSLNLNEAFRIYETLHSGNTYDKQEISKIGTEIFHTLSISKMVIHSSRLAMAWEKDEYVEAPTAFIDNPLLSTGAGDNFNAGFCIGLLCDLDLKDCLYLGHETAAHYMRTGSSFGLMNLN